MKIGKYISELLFENDFVILPELGEFSTKYIPAKFVPELKRVESPSKVITFNDKNKAGGGLLIEYIAKKENITSQQAREFVLNFVSEMHNSMKSGKKVELENVGVFALAEDGKISFTPDTSINYLSDSMGMSSVKEPAKKTEEQAKTELDKVMEETSARKTQEPAAPEKEADKEPQPMEKPQAATPTPAPTPETKPEAKPESEKKPLGMPQKPESKPVAAKTPAPKPAAAPKQRNGLPPALKWVAFTVVPLLIIIILVAFNYDFIFGEKSAIWRKDKTMPAKQEVISDHTLEEDITEVAPVEETFDPTVRPAAPERGRMVYYIIVGSFEEEHSADILAESLRSQGARTASVFPVNPAGFYRVYYGYYYDLQEAERDLQKAQAIHSDAWILHRRN